MCFILPKEAYLMYFILPKEAYLMCFILPNGGLSNVLYTAQRRLI